MFHYLTLVALLVVSVIAQNFNFTSPPASSTLELNSSSIIIGWNPGSETYNLVDLIFNGQEFGYTIAQNLSLSSGNFDWDPRNVSQALQSTQYELSMKKEYSFKANMHSNDSLTGAVVSSGEYKVEGYPYLSKNAAGIVRPLFGWVGVVLVSLLVAVGMSY